MNLEKMLEAQKALDDRIIKEKGLEGQDLFPNTVLALQVELAEFANEGRWFKHWSDDQKPRLGGKGKCVCDDGFIEVYHADSETEKKPCPFCEGTGIGLNTVLEEFADGVHFFLSLANQKGWQDALYVYEEQLDKDEFDGDLTGWYLEMIYFLNKSYMEKYSDDDKISDFQRNAMFFRMAWISFLNIGINGFGFTLEQIEHAYFDKNDVNHQRQENGY